jgi:hypothetical protein
MNGQEQLQLSLRPIKNIWLRKNKVQTYLTLCSPWAKKRSLSKQTPAILKHKKDGKHLWGNFPTNMLTDQQGYKEQSTLEFKTRR